MHEVSALLREATADAPCVAPLDAIHKQIRHRLQRRRTATVGVAALGAAGIAGISTRMTDESRPDELRPNVLASASGSTLPSVSSAAAAATECWEEFPAGFPRDEDGIRQWLRDELFSMQWPSGTELNSTVIVGGTKCDITVIMNSPKVAEEDAAAARERWGDGVVLKGLDDLPTPTTTAASGSTGG